MTEERLNEIEARAASFAWDSLTFRHGEELNGIIRLDIPDLVAALREAQQKLKWISELMDTPPAEGMVYEEPIDTGRVYNYGLSVGYWRAGMIARGDLALGPSQQPTSATESPNGMD